MADPTVEVTELSARLLSQQAVLEGFALLPAETLARAYAPGKWTGTQLIAHLADTEWVFAYRFLKAVAEPGTPVVPFDQDAWVAHLDGARRPVALSLAMIRAARAVLTHYLNTLPNDRLLVAANHPEKGPLTPLAMAELLHRHTAHHLLQLAAIRDGREWRPATG